MSTTALEGNPRGAEAPLLHRIRGIVGKVKGESWRRDSNPQPPVYKSQSAPVLQGSDLQGHRPRGAGAPGPAAYVPYEWAPMSAYGTAIR